MSERAAATPSQLHRRQYGPGRTRELLASAWIAQNDRWALWAPVAFGTGIAIYFALSHEPHLEHWFGAFVAATGILWVGKRVPAAGIPALTLWLLVAGYGTAALHANLRAAPVLERAYSGLVEGRVVAVEAVPARPRIQLDDVVLSRLPPESVPARVRLSLLPGESVQIGERISVPARLRPPPGPVSPGAFDFRRHAWFSQLGGTGYAVGHVTPSTQVTEGSGLWLSRLRHVVAERFRAATGGSAGAIAAALVTGDRSAIPADAIAAMRDSGLAHLLAISGLHMGLVATTLFFGVRATLAAIEPLALRFPIKKWAAVVALLGSFAYLLLSGATVPTQRAFVMTGFVLLAVILDRTALSLRLLAAAAFTVMLVAPQDVVGPSFQMSFAAVAALIAVYESLRTNWRRRWRESRMARIAAYPAGVAFTTVIAGFATGLIALYHFGVVAHYSVAANLLAVPLTAFWVMPCAVIAGLLLPFGLEHGAVVAMCRGIEAMLAVAYEVSSWPGAVQRLPAMPAVGLCAVVYGGLWLCLWRGWLRWLGSLGLIAGVATIWIVQQPDVLVSDDGGLIGVRLESGALAFNQVRRDRFTREQWMARYGLTPDTRPSLLQDAEQARCDSLGCVVEIRGRTVAVVTDPRALDEDCSRADVVVASIPAGRRCRRPDVVVDRFDLWRNGAHAITIGREQIRVESVGERIGKRLWSGHADGGR